MNNPALPALLALFFLLLLLSGFFSSSQTALMALNRQHLRHQAKLGQRSARLALLLLQRPDRLIGALLLSRYCINVLAASVAALIGLQLFGPPGLILAAAVVALLLLVFGTVAPKTLGALQPERIAFPASYLLWPLVQLLRPVVALIRLSSNGLLRLTGITAEQAAEHSISSVELRTLVAEAGAMIPQRHQKMLQSILDLERTTVEDIMVPRNEILGIDLSEPWESMRDLIVESEHTRLPLYEGSIDQLKGVVHLRRVVKLAADGELDVQHLLSLAREPYFIPEGTPLNQQLLNFQNQKRRVGFVVDEYGDIQGLVTLEDILEEVVGEFTSDPATRMKNVYANEDGSFRVTGNVTVRNLNRTLGWKLPLGGAKTINGLLVERLQSIPQTGARLQVARYEFEIVETRSNTIKSALVRPLG